MKTRYLPLVALVALAPAGGAQPPATPRTEKPVATFVGHPTEVVALAFSPDGKRVTSVGTKDVRVWHADSGKEIARSEHDGGLVFAIEPGAPSDRPWRVTTTGRTRRTGAAKASSP